MKNQISRRNFLKGTLAGAVSIAATGVLSACADSAAGTTEAAGMTEALTEAATAQTTTAPAEASQAAETESAAAAGAQMEAAGLESGVAPFTQLNPQDESYDTYTTDFAAVFSPIQVGHMTLKNRIVKASAGSDTLPRGAAEVSQNALDYYGRMADGGAALIIVEDGLVGGFGMNPQTALRTETLEEGIAQARRVADRIHEGGAYVGTQLGIGSPLDPGDVNAYTLDEIHDMVKSYGDAVRNLKAAGFDCVEMKGATTDGLNQFVSRRINMREDEYGAQTEENRVRFFTEIIKEMRAAAGDDFSILTLINAMEENDAQLGASDKFITIEEAQYLAKSLEEAGADLVQVRVATGGQEANCWAPDTNHCAYKAHGTTGYGTQFHYDTHFDGLMDGAHSGVGAFIPMAREIKKVVSVPVGCAGYVDPRTAPDRMNDAIANGDLDILFLNRPLTVDPELPNKLQAGRRDEVAPCTRCFHCHNKAFSPVTDPEACRVNATTQYAYTEEFPEGYELSPAETPKKVMVIGGGVAGMEAARIAAERGHEVTLYEKNGFLGGMLTFAEAVKGPHERLGDLRAYLERQQEVKGVTVVTGQEVTLDFVKEQNPDAVVVAVGGSRESRFSGSNVMDMDTAFAKAAELPENIVILGANLQATDMAQYLLAMNKKITLIHEGTADQVDKEQSSWVRKYARAHLYAHGVRVWNESTVDAVTANAVEITMRAGVKKTVPCDVVIECYDMTANVALLEELQAAGFEAQAAGCDAPASIMTSIHAGYKVGRYLN